jgi:cell wall-active antibiotic response 4TMS protein YvqF
MINGNELVRAVRGPIILITIGTLFALDHFTPWGFQQTWPVILIVIGLLTLVNRSTRSGPTAGGVA